MKRLVFALVALFLVISFVGCNRESTPRLTGGQHIGFDALVLEGTVDRSGKVLTTLVDHQPPPALHGNPFDGLAGGAGINWSLFPFLYGRLTDYSPLPQQTFKPDLLESFSYEGSVLNMTLKQGLKWSDGSPLTMADVLCGLHIDIGSAQLFNFATSAELINDHNMRITFLTESPLNLNIILGAMNLHVTYPYKVYGQWADQMKAYMDQYRFLDAEAGRYRFHDAGTETATRIRNDLLQFRPTIFEALYSGPYVFQAATTAESVMVINEHYYMRPHIEVVRGMRAASATAYMASIIEGVYTIENGGLSNENHDLVINTFAEDIRLVYAPEFSQWGFFMNYQMHPFNNPVVRKAFSHYADRDILLMVAEAGSFASDLHNTGMLPSLIPQFTSPGFMNTLDRYDYNPARGAALLEGIGWRKVNGIWHDENGDRVVMEIISNSWPMCLFTAEAYATMMREEGFDLTLRPMDHAAMLAMLTNGEYQLCSFALPGMAAYQHPWELFNAIFSPGATATRINLPNIATDEDRIMVDSSGRSYNTTNMLSRLYAASSHDEIVRITEEFMRLTNDLSLFLPVVEKSAPLRIYDPKLSLAPGGNDVVQNSFYYYGNLNNMLAKMIRSEYLFFVQ
ncbi:MAG: ABC transporter substrate-binding protein [Treponema sp.]|nr:ABC transporter substrate-binding protein [Treponema sp.]